MLKRFLIVLTLSALPAVAFAHSCPAYMEMIDEALDMAEEMGLSDEQIAEVERLREEGEEAHEEGEHDTALALLDQALGLLEH